MSIHGFDVVNYTGVDLYLSPVTDKTAVQVIGLKDGYVKSLEQLHFEIDVAKIPTVTFEFKGQSNSWYMHVNKDVVEDWSMYCTGGCNVRGNIAVLLPGDKAYNNDGFDVVNLTGAPIQLYHYDYDYDTKYLASGPKRWDQLQPDRSWHFTLKWSTDPFGTVPHITTIIQAPPDAPSGAADEVWALTMTGIGNQDHSCTIKPGDGGRVVSNSVIALYSRIRG
jgi:hypothetical protein